MAECHPPSRSTFTIRKFYNGHCSDDSRGCVKMQVLTHTRRCVRMVKMQGAEDEGAGSVLKYMTKPEDDSNAADWPL